MVYIPDMTERYPEGISYTFEDENYSASLDEFVRKTRIPKMKKEFAQYVRDGTIEGFILKDIYTDIYVSEAFFIFYLPEGRTIEDALVRMRIDNPATCKKVATRTYKVSFYC